jgi:hypothetical protein
MLAFHPIPRGMDKHAADEDQDDPKKTATENLPADGMTNTRTICLQVWPRDIRCPGLEKQLVRRGTLPPAARNAFNLFP